MAGTRTNHLGEQAKATLKKALRLASRFTKNKLLSETESMALLYPHSIWKHHSPEMQLAALISENGLPFFSEPEHISPKPDFVWQLSAKTNGIDTLAVSRSGAPRINHYFIPDIDFGNVAGLIDFGPPKPSTTLNRVIAPWSHYWGGYYDFTFFIAAKLARIREALSSLESWQNARVAYAMMNTSFEREWLQKLGLDKDKLIDTRKTGKIQVQELILGNNQRWFYPSREDVMRMRNLFAPTHTGYEKKKLFLARKGARKLLNQNKLEGLIREMGFEILEDEPMTVSDQISLFSEASLIAGVHGAAFSNILWAPPGARVLELFSGKYYPPYYYYLSTILGFPYRCVIDEKGFKESHHSARFESMEITPQALEKALRDWV